MKNEIIVLTGGGTAGHVTPNIILKDKLKKYFNEIHYIGSENGIEKDLILSQTPYTYHSITPVKFSRKQLLKNLLIPFKLSKAIHQAKTILRTINPNIIFSKGGYVGLPVVIAGKQLGIPVICHESDISMGLANKLAKRYANKICTSFSLTAKQNGKKSVHTGSPLKLFDMSKSKAKEKLNITSLKPTLLITGGSLGAKSINKFIYENIDDLTKKYYVLHLVGKGNLNKTVNHNDYKQIEFSSDMPTILKATDYAISRAGANTIYELFANLVPSIFIPLPKTVSRGDQIDNAKYFKSQGLCEMIFQENLNKNILFEKLNLLEKNAKTIKQNMKNAHFVDGSEKIINIILKEKD